MRLSEPYKRIPIFWESLDPDPYIVNPVRNPWQQLFDSDIHTHLMKTVLSRNRHQL